MTAPLSESVRVVLPAHLRAMAKVQGEIRVDVRGEVTQRSVLDALEAEFPMLLGTIRDWATAKRRAFVRFYACEEDLSTRSRTRRCPTGSSTVRSRSWWSVQWPAADPPRSPPESSREAQLHFPHVLGQADDPPCAACQWPWDLCIQPLKPCGSQSGSARSWWRGAGTCCRSRSGRRSTATWTARTAAPVVPVAGVHVPAVCRLVVREAIPASCAVVGSHRPRHRGHQSHDEDGDEQ